MLINKMDEELFKILKELKGIEPDYDYARRSRLLIVGEEKESGPKAKVGLFEVLKSFSSSRMALTAEIAALVIIFILAGVYYAHQSNQNLVVQANELNTTIQLKLNEITSYLNSQTAVNPSRISEVNLLLQKAAADLNEANADLKIGKLEESLAKMKSAQEEFSQIELIIRQ